MFETKKDKIKKDFKRIQGAYRANKKKSVKNFLLTFLFFLLALVFFGIKIMYPWHFYIGWLFFILTFIFFYRALLFNRKKIAESGSFNILVGGAKKRKRALVIFIVLIVLVYIFIKVSPMRNNPFAGLRGDKLHNFIEEDINKAVIIMDNMEIVGLKLINSPSLVGDKLSADEREELIGLWNNYIAVMVESEKLTEFHKFFNKISYIFYPREKAKSFIIAYSLYIKKYELFYRLIDMVGGRENIEKTLNDYSASSKSKNTYLGIVERFYDSDRLIKDNLGRVYILFLDLTGRGGKLGEHFTILRNKATGSYNFLLSKLDRTFIDAIRAGGKNLEQEMSDIWFPIQKSSASAMGNLHISTRDNKLITLDQINELKKKLEPGDILVERRNWYMSNIGIPGFWPHAALYVGDIQTANEYFKPIFPFSGYSDFSGLIEDKFSKLYKTYVSPNSRGFKYSVIEGKSPGIILLPLEESANADYVAAIRPRLGRKDILLAIMRAFGNYGKPYDYNFDFDTRDELVCSELVYDAYLPTKNKNGLNFKLRTITGRKIFSPTDIVIKYYDEKDKLSRELDFVFFIDGNEKLQKAFIKGEPEFAISWTRPKYDWLQE